MNATELRIGNLIEYFHPENGFIKFAIDIELLQLMESKDFERSDYEIEPIKLTEEWLIKFGFELNEDGYYQKESKDGDWLFMEYIDDCWCASVPYIWIETVPKEERKEGLFAESKSNYCMVNGNGNYYHVHQLQNLYHALTGEELAISE